MSLFLERAELGWQLVVVCDSCGEKVTSAASGHWGCRPGGDGRCEPVFVHTGCRETLDLTTGAFEWFPGGLDTFCLTFGTNMGVNWSQVAGVMAAWTAFQDQGRGN